MTQDYKEAMALGDRIAVLAAEVRPGGDARGHLPAPATVGVARLFGDPSINLSRRPSRRAAGGVVAHSAAARVALDGGIAGAAGSGHVGMRPEAVDHRRRRPSGLAADVMAVTPLNERTVLLLEPTAAGSASRRCRRPQRRAGGRARVDLAFAADGTHLFDRATARASDG